MVLQDVWARRALAVIDPHGDLAGASPHTLQRTPLGPHLPRRTNPRLGTAITAWNVLRKIYALAARDCWLRLKRYGTGGVGFRMAHILRNALFALIECGKRRLPDILRMLDTEVPRPV